MQQAVKWHKRHSKANLCFQLIRVVYDCLIKVDNRRGWVNPSGRSVAFKVAALDAWQLLLEQLH